ncbi:glycerate kinase, partial [Cellulomonas massiliensis]|uniref:glycerate kinase n=1 Tax=Cellulomonas massiliensis TaxID=1465811 RepID=UPI00058DFC40
LPDARAVLRSGGAALGAADEDDLRGLRALRDALAGVQLVGAYDTGTPLLGLQGASATLGSEPGVGAEASQALERALAHVARLAVEAVGDAERPDLLAGGRPVSRLTSAPGAGAGGGLGFGIGVLGGRLVPASALVADAVGLDALAGSADLVVTGVTRLDWRSVDESVVAEAARRALVHGVPTVVVADEVLVGRREQAAAGLTAAYAVSAGADRRGGEEVADRLAARTRRVARTWSPGTG